MGNGCKSLETDPYTHRDLLVNSKWEMDGFSWRLCWKNQFTGLKKNYEMKINVGAVH